MGYAGPAMSHQPFTLTMPVGPADHLLGSAHAPVQVVEYGDFECPHCRQAVSAVKLLLKHFEGKASFVFRHYPLEGVHPHAELAAEASESAGEQGKFWEMHDLLFENQAHLKASHLRSYAERLNLDMARFDAELRDHVYLQRVREHIRTGNESGIRSTPGFFVGGRIQDVSFGLDALFKAVEAGLARK